MAMVDWRHAAPAGPWVRRGALLLAALLLVDAVLLLAFLRWAFVTHHGLSESALFGRDFFSLNEGGLAEVWGFLKLGAATAVVMVVAAPAARGRSGGFYAALAALMLVMLLADSLQVHERLTALASLWMSPTALPVFDPAIKAALAAGPLAAMALAFRRLPRPDRAPAVLAASPVLLLGGVAGGLDFLHTMRNRWVPGGRTWTSLVEKGGEAVLASAALAAALIAWGELRSRRAQPSMRSASPI